MIAIGSSTILAHHFGLPVGSALVEKTANGDRPLGRDKFFVPGSVLRVAVDNTNPLAYGMPSVVDVFFDSSPALAVDPAGYVKGVRSVAWFDSASPLRSGWAWGQQYLEGATAVAEAPVGKGRLFLLAPEVTNRAQPHGTFKFLFNGIYYGKAETVKMAATPSPTAQQ